MRALGWLWPVGLAALGSVAHAQPTTLRVFIQVAQGSERGPALLERGNKGFAGARLPPSARVKLDDAVAPGCAALDNACLLQRAQAEGASHTVVLHHVHLAAFSLVTARVLDVEQGSAVTMRQAVLLEDWTVDQQAEWLVTGLLVDLAAGTLTPEEEASRRIVRPLLPPPSTVAAGTAAPDVEELLRNAMAGEQTTTPNAVQQASAWCALASRADENPWMLLANQTCAGWTSVQKRQEQLRLEVPIEYAPLMEVLHQRATSRDERIRQADAFLARFGSLTTDVRVQAVQRARRNLQAQQEPPPEPLDGRGARTPHDDAAPKSNAGKWLLAGLLGGGAALMAVVLPPLFYTCLSPVLFGSGVWAISSGSDGVKNLGGVLLVASVPGMLIWTVSILFAVFSVVVGLAVLASSLPACWCLGNTRDHG